MNKLFDILNQRGLCYQYTHKDLFDQYDKGGQTLYFGADPTSDSLHLGNFVVFMIAMHFCLQGNKLIIIVGGATGMIGDPGGKNSERSFLSEEEMSHNTTSILKQVQHICDHLSVISGKTLDVTVINNFDFYRDMNYLHFLREVGKYITINQMINKETVKKRIEDPDQSISYTEFSYMLLQAYDFWHLWKTYNTALQISGSDQRGNIVTGIELIRKKEDQEVYGMTGPLLVDSTGKKFGKSEGNALFLDPKKTKPFQLYQYFINTPDSDIEKYLLALTLLDPQEINAIVNNHLQKPELREGQKRLGYEVVRIIHGQAGADSVLTITHFLFGNEDKIGLLSELSEEMKATLVDEVGGVVVNFAQQTIVELLVLTGLCTSNGNAKKDIQAGAIFVNEQRVDNIGHTIADTDGINGLILIRKGKKHMKFVVRG